MTGWTDSKGRRFSHAIWSEEVGRPRPGQRLEKRGEGDDINYKDVKLLSGFVPERAKVLPRRISGTCAKHQRKLRVAIMRARVLALLPYLAD